MESGIHTGDRWQEWGEALGEIAGLGSEGLAEFVCLFGSLLQFLVILRALASKVGHFIDEIKQAIQFEDGTGDTTGTWPSSYFSSSSSGYYSSSGYRP